MADDKTFRISGHAWRAMRKKFEKLGPRHIRAARWMWDLKWTFAPGVLEKWLEPERQNETTYG
jgi:hypothetical protein